MKYLFLAVLAVLTGCGPIIYKKPDVDAASAPPGCEAREWVVRNGQWVCPRQWVTVSPYWHGPSGYGYVATPRFAYGWHTGPQPGMNFSPPSLPYVNGGSIPPPAFFQETLQPGPPKGKCWTGGNGQFACW